MVDFDVRNDNQPVNAIKQPSAPTVAAMKAAIGGSGVAASYPAATLHALQYNDLVYICRTNGIAVAGL
jgi:hypothetical protein